MKKILVVLLNIILMISYSFAQPPAIEWQKCLGGTNNDGAKSIQQTNDGGYIVAGYSYSSDGDVVGHHGTNSTSDYWVVKLDTDGTISWKKSLGGTNNDDANSLQQTNDGGYIVAGSTMSYDGDVSTNHSSYYDYWVVKLNSNGSIDWEKSLGGGAPDEAACIEQTSDGGYIVAGKSISNEGDVTGHHGTTAYADYWVVKLDDVGSIQWQKSLGGTLDDYGKSIKETSDGGYIVAGWSKSNDGDVTGHHGTTNYADCWVVRLDNLGTIQWQKSLGGTVDDYAHSIQQTYDGGYIVACTSNSNDGDVTSNHSAYNDYWVIKLSDLGIVMWEKCFGGTNGDNANSIQQTDDGGYIIAGESASNDGDVSGNHGSVNYWILKIDSDGNIEWQKSFGGSSFFEGDKAHSVQQTVDGGYVIAGASNSNDGDVIGHHGLISYSDYWVIKLEGEPVTTHNIFDKDVAFSISPNPSNEKFNLNFESKFPIGLATIEVYNSTGALVLSEIIDIQSNSFNKQINFYSVDGLYTILLITEGGIYTEKLMKSK